MVTRLYICVVAVVAVLAVVGYSVGWSTAVVGHKVLLAYLEACWPGREVVVADVEVVAELVEGLEVVVVANWDFGEAFDPVQEVSEDPVVHPDLDFVASSVVDPGSGYVTEPLMGRHCTRAVDHW